MPLLVQPVSLLRSRPHYPAFKQRSVSPGHAKEIMGMIAEFIAHDLQPISVVGTKQMIIQIFIC